MIVTHGTGLGSACLWRAGEHPQAFANFSLEHMQTRPRKKFVAAERHNQHAERVRSPETSLHAL